LTAQLLAGGFSTGENAEESSAEVRLLGKVVDEVVLDHMEDLVAAMNRLVAVPPEQADARQWAVFAISHPGEAAAIADAVLQPESVLERQRAAQAILQPQLPPQGAEADQILQGGRR
jgi:hypothetical protein